MITAVSMEKSRGVLPMERPPVVYPTKRSQHSVRRLTYAIANRGQHARMLDIYDDPAASTPANRRSCIAIAIEGPRLIAVFHETRAHGRFKLCIRQTAEGEPRTTRLSLAERPFLICAA